MVKRRAATPLKSVRFRSGTLDEPMWVVRWNEDHTVGEVVRMKDWSGLLQAPCVEGRIRYL